MTTTCHMSISLDGFVAGPDQSLESPLGARGMELHHWHIDEPLNEADARARNLLLRPRGAYVMGRNMFGPVRGPWQGEGRGGGGGGGGGGEGAPRPTRRSSSCPTTSRSRSSSRAGRRSTSSPRASTRR